MSGKPENHREGVVDLSGDDDVDDARHDQQNDETQSLLTHSHSSTQTKHSRYDSIHENSGNVQDSTEVLVTQNSGEQCNSSLSALCNKIYPSGFAKESKAMFTLTWPIVITQICQMVIGPISLIFCGHLGDAIKLDGAALAISLINATCIAVGQGLGTACDTFFSQTFGGSNKKLVGIYLQKAVLIFMLALMPCLALHMNVEGFLLLIGQHPGVARLAGQYMILFMPGALSFFMYIILSKYMQNQNIVLPNVFIGLFANGVNALLHYIFVYVLQYGTNGSAVAQASAYFVMFLTTLLYILISGCYKDTWGGWSTDCLQEWGKFVRLCLPGMLMLCMEWWGFEIGVFLTGLLGTTELGAQSVLLQLDSIWFQVPLGIQIATAIRVGQYLGAGQPIPAKTVGRLSISIVVLLSMVAVVIFVVFQNQLPALFTNVEEVVELTAKLLPIVAIYAFFDGVATACKGILYGTGRQILGASVLFVSYYCLALPMGIPLMFLTDLRTAAYWIALAINLVIQAIVLFIIVMRTDWDKQVELAQTRAGMIGEDDLISKSMQEQPRQFRRQRLLSASLSVAEIGVVMKPPTTLPMWKIVLRRLAALFVMLCILCTGIAVRVFIELPEYEFITLPEVTSVIYNRTDVIDYVTVSGVN